MLIAQILCTMFIVQNLMWNVSNAERQRVENFNCTESHSPNLETISKQKSEKLWPLFLRKVDQLNFNFFSVLVALFKTITFPIILRTLCQCRALCLMFLKHYFEPSSRGNEVGREYVEQLCVYLLQLCVQALFPVAGSAVAKLSPVSMFSRIPLTINILKNNSCCCAMVMQSICCKSLVWCLLVSPNLVSPHAIHGEKDKLRFALNRFFEITKFKTQNH